jgi:hypothetical protein
MDLFHQSFKGGKKELWTLEKNDSVEKELSPYYRCSSTSG